MTDNVSDYIKKDHMIVLVKPNASKTEFLSFDKIKGAVRVSISAVPDKGKANAELLKFLKKSTGRKCEILSGSKSRQKLIRFFP